MAATVANSRSQSLHQRALAVMPAGNTRITLYAEPYPQFAATGRGARVVDVDGEERIDFLNNFFSMIHGHAHPAIAAAAIAQIERGTCFGMPTEADVLLAERICERVPSVDEVRFMNSGSEAVLVAIKAARAFTGRPKIAKLEGAYHGMYDHVEVSQTSTPDNWGTDLPASVPYAKGTPQSILDDVVVIPFNDIDGTIRALNNHAGQLAAVLIDALPSRCGMVPIEPDYLAAISAFCRENGVLLLLDEVISLRLAVGGAQSLLGLRPDLTIMGKIIGGGFPVGAIGGRREVMAVFDPRGGKPRVPHGGTFTANPVTMAAGVVALDLLDASAIDRLNSLGEELRKRLTVVLTDAGVPGSVTGQGSLFRIHLVPGQVRDYRTSFADKITADRVAALHYALMARGIVVSGSLSGALSTPMIEADLAAFERALAEAIRAIGG